jgi:RES domain-containing protein
MELFRLTRRKYAEILSGAGAAIKGARWNSVGIEVIYTASNRSLAMAEVAVHFSMATVPDDYVMTTIYVPDSISMEILADTDLPPGWSVFPHLTATQKIGDLFILENKNCLLRVPSSVTKGDHNVLINPGHKDFRRIKIIDSEPFPFDSRIFR